MSNLKIISPGFNCAQWIPLWYNSLKVQSYKDWEAFIIDDASTDNTAEIAKLISDNDSRIHYVVNDYHKYQLGNWYDLIHSDMVSDDDIIIFLDLDDWLGERTVLEDTMKEYLLHPNLQITTAPNFSLRDYLSHEGSIFTDIDQLEEDIHQFSLFSYKSKLFRKIPKSLLMDSDGNFFKMYGDYAIVRPMLLMATPKNYRNQYRLVNGVVYNNIHSLNDDTKASNTLEDKARIYKSINDKFHSWQSTYI